ncbi:FecCD family ABC transporter permease [Vibrio nigripulchritudo]|uniref:FecCD family ABC transporter permease n=1 Tax=Vibrio nigripulchritudo TaxID=28173 RepID=UPI00249330FD|nr:iron ABC transporter permease [Vibrio nigripulchritudo]BDU41029.1 iron ABC transporter [Vibrio nigripulchritudo]BDU46769.1 iron ABC transporter [Vibrio nigripulchritudo]
MTGSFSFSEKSAIRTFVVCFALFSLLLFGASWSLINAPSFPMNWSDVSDFVLQQDGNAIHQQIISSIRLPRTLTAFLVGAGLAVAGLLMQSITRNPLASPSILGVSAGSAFAFAFASTGLLPWLAGVPILVVTFVGAALSGTLVFFLAGLHTARPHPLRIVLAGIALNFLFISLTRAAVIYADENAYGVLHWLTGSVANTDWEDTNLVMPCVLIGLFVSVYLSFQLNLLKMGEEMMRSVGGSVFKVRGLACFVIVLLIAGCVSVAGPIAFIGLIAPHIAFFLVGSDVRYQLPVAALLGANLVLFSDIASRYISPGQESPVGIITTLFGALFFLAFVRFKLGRQS